MPPKQGQRAPSDIRRPAVTGAPVGRRVVNPRGVSGFRRLLDGGTRALGRHRALGAADLGLEPYPGRGDPDATRSCTRTESRRSAPSCGCARHNTHTRVLPAIMFSASQAPVRSPLHPQVSHDISRVGRGGQGDRSERGRAGCGQFATTGTIILHRRPPTLPPQPTRALPGARGCWGTHPQRMPPPGRPGVGWGVSEEGRRGPPARLSPHTHGERPAAKPRACCAGRQGRRAALSEDNHR